MLKSCAWLCLGVALAAVPAAAQNPAPEPTPIPPQLPAPLVPPEPLPAPAPAPVPPANPLLQNRQLVEAMWRLIDLNGDALADDFLPLPTLFGFRRLLRTLDAFEIMPPGTFQFAPWLDTLPDDLPIPPLDFIFPPGDGPLPPAPVPPG